MDSLRNLRRRPSSAPQPGCLFPDALRWMPSWVKLKASCSAAEQASVLHGPLPGRPPGCTHPRVLTMEPPCTQEQVVAWTGFQFCGMNTCEPACESRGKHVSAHAQEWLCHRSGSPGAHCLHGAWFCGQLFWWVCGASSARCSLQVLMADKATSRVATCHL